VPSELFDPLLELAFSVAQKGHKTKPRVAAPARLTPMLRFTKMPARARQTIWDVLDSDEEFRARVAKKADERTVGRAGMAMLERDDGWQELIDRLVEAAEEPVLDMGASDARKAEHRLGVAERSLARMTDELDAATTERDELAKELDDIRAAHAAAVEELATIRESNRDLAEQRQRAVAELKKTEVVMARHITERKLAEQQLQDMAAAQLSTTLDGGAITDAEVRDHADRLAEQAASLADSVAQLRERATPQRTPVARRTPMPLPPGVHDDGAEAAEYLIRIPKMVVLVDGYNVTRSVHDDWSIEEQRLWLAQGLRTLASRCAATFDVVFDGADVPSSGTGERDSGVCIRFSPDGVEADDVVIDAVRTVAADHPVTVVSSDKRVVRGAKANGANTISSQQLLELLN
jgi:predicted RNA-binding protein with PIN domain